MIANWLGWLAATPLSSMLRESIWLYPIVEALHIGSFVIVVGAAVMFDLRLLGMSPQVRVTDMARHLLPCARWAMVPVAITGMLLFATQPVEMAESVTFRLKLALIALAGANAFAFHRWTFTGVERWDRATPTPVPAKAAGLVSLTLWAGVIGCGRFLAYL